MEIENPKHLGREVRYRGKSWDVVEDEFELPSGGKHSHLTVMHPGAVVVLPVEEDGRIVLIEQYRYSLGRTILEAPAGTLGHGESPKACVERELKEEIGRKAREIVPLGQLTPAPGFCDEIQHCFLARGLGEDTGQPDEDEIIHVVAMSTGDVEQAIAAGVISDAKTIAIFYRAKLKGLI